MVAAAPKASMILSCFPVGLMSGKAVNRDGRLSCREVVLSWEFALKFGRPSLPLPLWGRLSRFPRSMESAPSLLCSVDHCQPAAGSCARVQVCCLLGNMTCAVEQGLVHTCPCQQMMPEPRMTRRQADAWSKAHRAWTGVPSAEL